MRRLAAWILAGMVAAIPVRGQDATEASRIQGFRVPTFDEEGRMTAMIFGDFAMVLPDGMVEITQLRMEFYDKELDENGERVVQMTVESPTCFYHRGREVAVSDSAVKITREGLVVMGEGFMWNNRDQTLKIISKARVEVSDRHRNVARE
ncbi:MAG TPA: LPS export ABC transporter periplasmic protein LptC [Kiritimatiellia bacterium]|nr:LPS export ABC transporter periplasmic protein LptC [Kiritimatiellia bacterium]